MARGNRQDLYLQVSGDIVGLRQAMTAGRTVVNEFGGAAINVIEEVEKEFKKLGSGGLPNLKQVEASYTATFKRIGDQARAVLDAPTPQRAVQIIDAGAARQAAEQATAQAAGLRLVAEAASRADVATGGADRATRAFAVAAATAALGAEDEARALREQAVVLGNVERQLGVNGAAQRRAVVVNGQARAGYQQLSYQMGDVATQYASGTAASIIFAQQSGQVIQAIGMITGETKGFLGFIGGPWGIALSSAVVMLTPLVSKLLEGDDALKKETKSLEDNAAKAAISAQAKEAFGKSEKGVIDDVRALTEEIDKQNDSLKTNAERMNIRAKQDLENGKVARDKIAADLAKAREELAAARVAPSGGGTAGMSSNMAAITYAEGQVRKLEARLKAIDKTLAGAEAARLATQKDLSGEAADRALDPLAQIKRDYEGPNGLIEQAKKRASAEEVVNGALTRQLRNLKEQQKLDTEKEQKRISASRSPGTGNNQFGREIDVAEARAIAASIGGRVTSGVRSTERQAELYADKLAGRHNGPVAKPGTSAHETGNAIDIAYGAGISVKSIREAFAKEGVKLSKILNEPGQRVFHVEFGKAGPSAATTARKAEVEADRKTQNAYEYASLLSRAKEQQAGLERSRVTSIAEAADLDVAAVKAAQEDLDRAAQKGVELDKWTQAEADAVKAVNASAASLQTQSIRDRARLELTQRWFEFDQAALDDKIAMLRLDGDLATTAADRRKIARQLLKLEQEQVELALRNQIAAEKDPARKGILERRLQQTPQEYERKRQALDQQNADPLQSYVSKLRSATDDMDEALKGVAADGFGALEDASSRAASQAITDLLGIGGAAGEVINGIISDLIRLAVQKAIVSAIGSSVGLPFADGGKVPGFADGGIPGYAGGGVPYVDDGLIRGPGDGRSDSILALVGGRKPIRISNGEGIVNARGVRKHWALIDAINKDKLPKFADGGLVAPAGFVPRLPSIRGAQQAMRQDSRLQLEANVTVNAGPEFDARMERVSLRTVGATAEPIMAGAQARTMKKLQRRDLPGGWG